MSFGISFEAGGPRGRDPAESLAPVDVRAVLAAASQQQAAISAYEPPQLSSAEVRLLAGCGYLGRLPCIVALAVHEGLLHLGSLASGVAWFIPVRFDRPTVVMDCEGEAIVVCSLDLALDELRRIEDRAETLAPELVVPLPQLRAELVILGPMLSTAARHNLMLWSS